MIARSIDQQHMCLMLLKVDQSTFTQTSFSSLSDVHEYSVDLQMTPSSLGKQTADCDLLHNWLMSMAMDLADMCREMAPMYAIWLFLVKT